MNADYYIGEFIINIYASMEEYKSIYGKYPATVAVDEEHFSMIRKSPYTSWINPENMEMMNGTKIVEEKRYKGTFMSMRNENYRSR